MPSRWLLVTQRVVGDDTSIIRRRAPKTWQYLKQHASRLDARKSSIYRDRPQFSIFGIGNYSFAPFKVAISGLYKHLSFARVAPHHSKPVMLDDTCAFLACRDEAESEFIHTLLSSDIAQSFFNTRIFWDAKRPVTTEVLNQLDLLALADAVDPAHPVAEEWRSRCSQKSAKQGSLF